MNQKDLTEWSLLVSETWYSLFRAYEGTRFGLSCKTYSIVVFDRVMIRGVG